MPRRGVSWSRVAWRAVATTTLAAMAATGPGLAPTAAAKGKPDAAPATSQSPGNAKSPAHSQRPHATNAPGEPTTVLDVAHQIGADDLWAAGYTGGGVDVAVIDTGVAPINELSTTNIFVGPDLSLEGGVDGVAGLDTYGHGTHMVGIIAGRTPGADPLAPSPGDFVGIAPDAGIVSVKVADNTGAVDVSQVIAAIDWVVQHRQHDGLDIRVLNLSYNNTSTQSPSEDPLSKAIENAWNHGIVVVVSSGNEGRSAKGLASPATNPYVIAVSSVRLDDDADPTWTLPSWAPSGDGVRNPDVLAPGQSLLSLRNPGSRVDVEHPDARHAADDRLFAGSGTSQSAAVVSGAAALLIDQRPDLTPDQVKHLLTASAITLEKNPKHQGHGVIDLGAAMQLAPPAATQQFPPATGLGSLEAARGTDHISIDGTLVTGEFTVTGAAWDPVAWVASSEAATTWSGDDAWSGSSWSGSSWSGSSWSGSSWSGSSWSGSSWSGSSWSGSSWSGSSWSGSSWSGLSWSGSSWSGSSWSGSSWSGSSWSGSSWS
ncbi:MAG: S8 family serine peptidase [Ilumatobacter sp.]|nr:S8 family serine peptidase [Ilumatobacter sp.]